MANNFNFVAEAIRRLGGPKETVGRLYMHGAGVAEATLYRWRKAGRVDDVNACIVLSELTGLTPRQLAPRDADLPTPDPTTERRGAREASRGRPRRCFPSSAPSTASTEANASTSVAA